MIKIGRTENVYCDICGSDDSQVIFKADKECGPIVKCNNCGLIYSNPRDIFNYAQGRTHSGYISQLIGKKQAFEYRANQLIRFKRPGRLLEVGSHHGFFLDVARTHGWKVLGVEPDRSACEWAKINLDIEMVPLSFSDVGFEMGTFDVIVLFNVLEHLPSPTAALKKASRLLEPNGILFVEVPHIYTIMVKLFGKKWIHFEPTHYYYFSGKTLSALMMKTGFKVLDIQYLPKFLTLLLIIDVFDQHIKFPRRMKKFLHSIIIRMGLDKKYIRLKSKDFLGVIAKKCL